jgi:hypothetical protein
MVEKEIKPQSDRGAAILASAMVQDSLVAAILDRLPTKSTDIEKMFDAEGEVANF